MVMLDNVFDIYHMRRALEMFQTFKRDRKRIYTCFTRVNPCTEEERLKIQRELGYPVTDILPNEYQMISLANSGRLLKGLPTDSFFMQCMEKLADDMEISKPIDLIDRTVHLSVNKNINRVIITVVDKESNEVVSEFPCEEIQHLAAHLKEVIGLLYDDEA